MKDKDRAVKVKVSLSPKVMGILDNVLLSRGQERLGNFSPLIAEIILEYDTVRKYKQIEAAKLKQGLENLGFE